MKAEMSRSPSLKASQQAFHDQVKAQHDLTENLLVAEYEIAQRPKKGWDDQSLKLRRQLDEVLSSNQAKEAKLAKLTSEQLAVSQTSTVRSTGVANSRGSKGILSELEKLDVMISDELFTRTSLEHIKNRVTKERLVHYERLLQMRQIGNRLNANYEEAKRTEAFSVNHFTVARNDVVHLHRTREAMRTIYQDGLKKFRSQFQKETNHAQEAIERMSYREVKESERLIENKRRLELIQTKANTVREQAALLSLEATKLQQYRALIRRVLPIAVYSGCDLDPEASDFRSTFSSLLKLSAILSHTKDSLELRYAEIAEIHLEKRAQCDLLRSELDDLKRDNSDLMSYKPHSVYSVSDFKDQIRLLKEQIKLKQATAAGNEALLAKLFLEIFQLSCRLVDFAKMANQNGEASHSVLAASAAAEELIEQLKRSFKQEVAPVMKSRYTPRKSKVLPTTFMTEVEMNKQTESSIKKIFISRFPQAYEESMYLAMLLSSCDIVCLFVSSRELEVYLQQFKSIDEVSKQISDVFKIAFTNLLVPATKLGEVTCNLLGAFAQYHPELEGKLTQACEKGRLKLSKVDEAMSMPFTKAKPETDAGIWAQTHILRLRTDLGIEQTDELPRIRPDTTTSVKSKTKDGERTSIAPVPQAALDAQKSAEEQRSQIKSKLLSRRLEGGLEISRPTLPRTSFPTNRMTTAEVGRIRDFKQIYDSLTFLRRKDKIARTHTAGQLKSPSKEKWRTLTNRRSVEDLLKSLYYSPNQTMKSPQTEKSRSFRRFR
jgi:hypothetical protein